MRFFMRALQKSKEEVQSHRYIFCLECVLRETSILHKRKNKLISLITAISQDFIVASHLKGDTFSNTGGVPNIKPAGSIFVQGQQMYLLSPAVFPE